MASKLAKELSINPTTASAPLLLPDQPKGKRRPSDTKATVARKRQKGKDVRKEEVQSALDLLSLAWKAKTGAAATWRVKTPSEPGTTLAILIKTWNVVRGADRRPALTDTQVSLVPQNEQLHSLFSHMFTSPLTWDAALFSTILKRHDGLGDPTTNLAQYYIRRLKFEDQNALSVLLEKVKALAPQYNGQIKNLLEASSGILGSFFVSYGGFTVANSPVGRDLNDTEDSKRENSRGGFLKTVLELYKGTVLIYEVLPLAFEIGSGGRNSVKASRGDPRTSLYESLVIDSMGFLSFNTAAAGTVIEFEPSVESTAMKEAIKLRRTSSHKPFSWQIPAASSSSA